MNPNPRVALQTTVLASTRAYEREALERVRQMSLTAADLEVKNAKRIVAPSVAGGPAGGVGGPGGVSGEGAGEVWSDDSGAPIGMVPLQGQT